MNITLMCHIWGRKKVVNRELKGKFGAEREVEREELRGVEIAE
jgi:hypothetical protein